MILVQASGIYCPDGTEHVKDCLIDYSNGVECNLYELAGVKCYEIEPDPSCEGAFHTTCCISSAVACQVNSTCFCDRYCHISNDCCNDADYTCPAIGEKDCSNGQSQCIFIPTHFHLLDNCMNGEVRLRDPDANTIAIGAGRVEMCVDGNWGTICGWHGWNQEEAIVVCNQLDLNSSCKTGSKI